MTEQPLAQQQTEALRQLLATAASNGFYGPRLAHAGIDPQQATIEDFVAHFPLTTKDQLLADQQAYPPFGTNRSEPLEAYTRFHQTSGSTGTPMRWLDTPQSWSHMVDNWQIVFKKSGVSAVDRIFFAFSFGPFLGFWTAFDAGERLGALCIPGGGLSSLGRLQLIAESGVTTLCCTPTYAIHLGRTAQEKGQDLARQGVRRIIVAGEPGGSLPSVRNTIGELWPNAQIADHHGMTEVGPVSYQCPRHPHVLHLISSAFLSEILEPGSNTPVAEGQRGELVLTTLGRRHAPLLRYRTGDLVQKRQDPCGCATQDLALEGGILGRADQMQCVRGVNLFPAAIEAVVRRFEDIEEFQVHIAQQDAMAEVRLEIEVKPSPSNSPETLRRQLEEALKASFSLRIPVAVVTQLPRFQMKAKRWNVH